MADLEEKNPLLSWFGCSTTESLLHRGDVEQISKPLPSLCILYTLPSGSCFWFARSDKWIQDFRRFRPEIAQLAGSLSSIPTRLSSASWMRSLALMFSVLLTRHFLCYLQQFFLYSKQPPQNLLPGDLCAVWFREFQRRPFLPVSSHIFDEKTDAGLLGPNKDKPQSVKRARLNPENTGVESCHMRAKHLGEKQKGKTNTGWSLGVWKSLASFPLTGIIGDPLFENSTKPFLGVWGEKGSCL